MMDISDTDDIQELIREDEANDTQDEQLTAAQLIEIMEEAWINEKFAPEVLPHKYEVVELLLGQIQYFEERLEDLDDKDFQKNIRQMEIDRLRYLVSSYLRNRLEKIENFAVDIVKEEEKRLERNEDLYLTPAELEFARNYVESLSEHFDSVLSFWPGLPPDDWKKEPVTPNMYSFVFLKSKENVEGVVIDDDDEDGDIADLTAGSQMIISYKSVGNLIKNGVVKLI